ncbi:hypothetical protein [Ralstonia solanacearum]|uniref:hypothetical protein n=1 Tax=Ralstonia solanacearum TaxID=305 RepID=UPI00399D59BE
MSPALVACALEMALQQRRLAPGLGLQSDRGAQYASGEYQGVRARNTIVCSMTHKGDCWDNAVAERPDVYCQPKLES